MLDTDKTKKQLIEELADARKRLAANRITSQSNTSGRATDGRDGGTGLEAQMTFDMGRQGSESEFKALAENSMDVIMRFDKQRRHLYVNPIVESVIGIKPDEFIGKTHEELGFPRDLCRFWANGIDAVIDSKETNRLEFQLPNGIWFDWILIPEFSPDGEVSSVMTSARDITDLKQAEEEIRKFRTIADRASHGSAIANLDGELVYINAYFAGVHGYTSDELLGKNLAIFHTREQMPSVAKANEILKTEGRYDAREVWHVHRDGTEFPMLMSGIVVKNVNGEPAFLAATAIDITARIRAEERLRNSEERYRIINDATRDFIYSYDTFSRFTSANKSLCDALQKSEDQIIGRTHAELGFPSEQCEEWDDLHTQVLETDSRILRETSTPMPDGIFRYYEVELNPLHDQTGRILGISGSTRDVTERVNAQREREIIFGQLQQAQKMESIGRLAGGVAHDFNNLLQVINVGTEIAMDPRVDETLAHQSLDEVAKAGKRAATLVSQLLLFSRRQHLSLSVIDLNEVIVDLLKMLGRIIGEHIHLEWSRGAGTLTIQADRGMVEQALMNLCVNARDAMPNGGTLTIETIETLVDADFCRIYSYATPGRYALLRVSDTGSGMDKDILEHIFEPFYTTKETGQGTGLGLATVYGIVKQHKGMIVADSDPDRGTIMNVYWPLSAEEAQETVRAPKLTVRGGTDVLLLAEDDEMVRNLTQSVLERAGYTVILAQNGEEAVTQFRKHAERIELAILDVVMPKMSGYEAFSEMRKMRPGLKAVFTSGYSNQDQRIFESGVTFIRKPYPGDALLTAARELLDASLSPE